MKVFNLGSLNLDHTYQVPHFVSPGETLASLNYERGNGGKGLNQSIALARAGTSVVQMGMLGADGAPLIEALEREGVDCSNILRSDGPTGHAIIQVDPQGENSIVLFSGANQQISAKQALAALEQSTDVELFLTQNETSAVRESISAAKRRGLIVAFNPAPISAECARVNLNQVDHLILNLGEGTGLTGENEVEKIVSKLVSHYPELNVVLTLGSEGVLFRNRSQTFSIPAEKVTVVDTTAAGDVFVGFYLASILRGMPIEESLKTANRAAGMSVTKLGSVRSIPYWNDVLS